MDIDKKMYKKAKYRWWLLYVGVVVMFAFVVGISNNVTHESSDTNNSQNMRNIQVESISTNLDLKTYIVKIIDNNLPVTIDLKKPKIREVIASKSDNDSTKLNITISLNYSESLTKNMLQDRLFTDSKKILSELAIRNDVNNVVINQFVSFNNSKDFKEDIKLLSISFTKDKIDNINWNSVSIDDIKKLSDKLEITELAHE